MDERPGRDSHDYKLIRRRAQHAVAAAVKRGGLIRLTVCEQCGIGEGESRFEVVWQVLQDRRRRYWEDGSRMEFNSDGLVKVRRLRHGRIEAHHRDYSRPLDVQWLCRECHYKADVRDSGLPDSYGGYRDHARDCRYANVDWEAFDATRRASTRDSAGGEDKYSFEDQVEDDGLTLGDALTWAMRHD